MHQVRENYNAEGNPWIMKLNIEKNIPDCHKVHDKIKTEAMSMVKFSFQLKLFMMTC